MKCPNCDTDNPASDDFCSNCGAYLHESGVAGATLTSVDQKSVSHKDDIEEGSQASDSTTTTSTLVPNTQLQAGRYIVTRILGQGGMGAAVLAQDTRVSNKLVVIKELISDETDLAQRQEDVRNFKREVETLAKLDHPLIPAVTDSFQEGSHYFMVQDYVAGENLEDHMERLKQSMPEQEALTYISQVLDILQYLAQQQPPIVHRDIKPANIIISSRDKLAHLVDFGIARADEAAKQSQRKQTSALGTPGYAPPEQYQGNADARSDLYALAATLHFLLTHRDPRDEPPFNYPRVRTLNAQLSLEAERVLDRALMLDITKRYQNAVAMKQDIDEILLHDFGLSSDGSIYLRGSSGTLAPPSRSRTSPVSPGRPERPKHPDPISPLPPSYAEGLRPLPRSEYAPPRQPTYRDSWREEPYAGSYQRQQMEQPRRQQQMFMLPMQNQPQSENSRMITMSFIMLLIVVAIIAGVLFVLPYLQGF